MTLVDKNVKDLVSGFDRIRDAHLKLSSAWRSRLLGAYASKRQVYDQGQTRVSQLRGIQKWIVVPGLVLAGLFVAGGLVTALIGLLLSSNSSSFGPLLILGLFLVLGGLFFGGVLGLAGLWAMAPSKSKPPSDPMKAGLIQPLLPSWWDGLRGRLQAPAVEDDDGTTGEHSFINRLQSNLDSSYFILYGIQQRHGEDVDVILVGPKGVWVFEVKFWSGTIYWHEGVWARSKTYHVAGGRRVTQPRSISQPPDEQWRRTSGDVAETIRRRVPDLASRFTGLAKIRGGIVFTHPDAVLQIGPGCPAAWGNLETWVKRIKAAPTIPGWNERVSLQILDVLLIRHRRVSREEGARSMDAYARQLIRTTEDHLDAYVDHDRAK